MKRNNILLPIAALWMLCSCGEQQYTGQYPVDSDAPDPVSNVQVENIRGGAVLTYDLPTDMDMLYVEAKFDRNGITIRQKASVYSSGLLIEGLGRSKEQTIELRTYDRSSNASTPVTVSIHPLDAPIFAVMESLEINDDFGGVRLEWKNEDEAPVMLMVLAQNDEKSGYEEAGNFTSKRNSEKKNIRGYSDESRTFAFFAHDRWGNFTDTVYSDHTPLLELQLDKSKFRRWNPSEIPYNGGYNGVWDIEQLWDNNLTVPKGWATQNGCNDFTFDMGQVAKLSRFTINQRPEANLCYAHAHPKRFSVYGSLTPDVGKDTAKWSFIGDFESIQPSGAGAGKATADDIQYASVEGEAWSVASEAPKFRYFRFICHETWGASPEIQIMEITIWGQIYTE